MPRLIRAALERAKIPKPERVATGVDVVGDLAVVRLPGLTSREKKRLGGALIDELRYVKGVFEQEGGIEGEYRLRKLKHLAGEDRTATVHRENGCVFKVDIERCYFSPRLSTERLRVARLARPSERVLNMFAGVGPFSVAIAKVAKARVQSWEVNDFAVRLHEENDRLNRVEELVSVTRGDAATLAAEERRKYDRVLMPHPSQADRFLEAALGVIGKKGTIHYYRHVLGRDPSEAEAVLRGELAGFLPPRAKFGVRRVREVGPRWVEMAADIRVP